MTSATLFPKLNDHQIQCAKDIGDVVELADGQTVFKEGEPASYFFVVLEGRIKVTRRGADGQPVALALHEPRDFTGATELLTGEMASASGITVGNSRLVRVPVERFRELIAVCPEMQSMVIPALTERRAAQFAIQTQQEKLAALGKLSAGLAHELNNPASAARRSAQNLRRILGEVEGVCCRMLQCVMSKTSQEGSAIQKLCELMSHETDGTLDPLAQSDYEQELESWLAKRQVNDAQEAAASLAGAGISVQDLEPIAAAVSGNALSALLGWLAKDVEMRALCRELQQSTERMSDLVCAMKSYSHMDQAPVKAPTDLREGIETTLVILKHKLKKKNISLSKEFAELPKIPAIGGELNQVWTNLIDNAIDAVPEGGHIAVRTSQQADRALVEVIDDGPGIPPQLRSRIFEPFFTTKGVGQGTGLGLDTSYRIIKSHGGEIRFESEPGNTRFKVILPLK